jgi:hypothetical protein
VFLMTIFWMRFFFGERGLKRRSMSWPSRQSPGFFFFSLSLRFYPLVLSFSLTSMAESAASAALCAADFLGLADAATEREAGGGEPTERRRKCDAADGGGSGARCCCCGAAAAATALRGAPNELLLAMPPRVATTTGCCIFKKRRAKRTKGSCRRSGTPPKKNLDESKCKPTEQNRTLSERKRERQKKTPSLQMRLSLACLAASAARTVSRRAQRGIYAGKDVRSGNKVSEDGGNR